MAFGPEREAPIAALEPPERTQRHRGEESGNASAERRRPMEKEKHEHAVGKGPKREKKWGHSRLAAAPARTVRGRNVRHFVKRKRWWKG